MSPKVMDGYTDLRKKQITEAAWNCFCEMGYEKTTVRAIASEMNTTTGVIYKYFSSKDDILKTIVDFSIIQNKYFFDKISENFQGLNAIFKSFSIGFLEFPSDTITKSNKGNINLWVEAIKSKKVKSQLQKFYIEFMSNYTKYIREIKKSSKRNIKIDPEILSGFFLALFIGFQVQQVIMKESLPKFYFESVLKMIQKGVTIFNS